MGGGGESKRAGATPRRGHRGGSRVREALRASLPARLAAGSRDADPRGSLCARNAEARRPARPGRGRRSERAEWDARLRALRGQAGEGRGCPARWGVCATVRGSAGPRGAEEEQARWARERGRGESLAFFGEFQSARPQPAQWSCSLPHAPEPPKAATPDPARKHGSLLSRIQLRG